MNTDRLAILLLAWLAFAGLFGLLLAHAGCVLVSYVSLAILMRVPAVQRLRLRRRTSPSSA